MPKNVIIWLPLSRGIYADQECNVTLTGPGFSDCDGLAKWESGNSFTFREFMQGKIQVDFDAKPILSVSYVSVRRTLESISGWVSYGLCQSKTGKLMI